MFPVHSHVPDFFVRQFGYLNAGGRGAGGVLQCRDMPKLNDLQSPPKKGPAISGHPRPRGFVTGLLLKPVLRRLGCLWFRVYKNV